MLCNIILESVLAVWSDFSSIDEPSQVLSPSS